MGKSSKTVGHPTYRTFPNQLYRKTAISTSSPYVIQKIKLRTSFFAGTRNWDCGSVCCWLVGSKGGQNRARISSLSQMRTMPLCIDSSVRRSRSIKWARSRRHISRHPVAGMLPRKNWKRNTGNTREEWGRGSPMKFLLRYAAFSPSSITPCTDGFVPASHSIRRHSSPILLYASSLSWRWQSSRKVAFQRSKGS